MWNLMDYERRKPGDKPNAVFSANMFAYYCDGCGMKFHGFKGSRAYKARPCIHLYCEVCIHNRIFTGCEYCNRVFTDEPSVDIMVDTNLQFLHSHRQCLKCDCYMQRYAVYYCIDCGRERGYRPEDYIQGSRAQIEMDKFLMCGYCKHYHSVPEHMHRIKFEYLKNDDITPKKISLKALLNREIGKKSK